MLIKDYKKHNNIQTIDKSVGSLYNSFRSKVYSKKGKAIGFPDKWKTFEGFKEDVSETWEKGLILIRQDNSKPYSKENCIWVEKGFENINKLIKLEYLNEIKTLMEWCIEFNLNYNGVRQRYFKGKNYSNEEILFGKKRKTKKDITDINELNLSEQRSKASKMISSYKNKDNKKGYNCDLTIEFMIDLMNKPCTYCGDKLKIGADRLDNSIGHIISNVIPSCYTCNVVRNNIFTYEEMLIMGKTINIIKNNRITL